MKRTTYFNATLIIAAGLCFSCGPKPAEQPAAEHHDENEMSVSLSDVQYKTAGIEIGIVTTRQISGVVKANGVLDVPPQQMVSISVPLGGFVKSTELLQGSHVRRGQVIATIENMDFIQLQQDYLEARNQLALAMLDYDRQQELARENVNAQKTLQQSKSAFDSWQAKANGLREKLRLIKINITALEGGKIVSTVPVFSPIDGYVTEVNVNIGKYVTASDVLFEIVDTEHLHAELTIFEKDVPRIRIGQRVRFTLANESLERTATVHLIGREIGADRTVRIHCHIDQEDRELLPGMYLRALVEAGGSSVPALPDEAIVSFDGDQYIFALTPAGQSHERETGDSTNHVNEGDGKVSEEHHFEMIRVQAGNSELGYTEVTIPADKDIKQVVVKGAYALLSKMKNGEEEGHAH